MKKLRNRLTNEIWEYATDDMPTLEQLVGGRSIMIRCTRDGINAFAFDYEDIDQFNETWESIDA